jgi:hypothetical protein
MHGGGMNLLACDRDDLVGVDLASLGLPRPWDPKISNQSAFWCYWSHPLGSLPRDKVRIEDYQRGMRDIEAARIAAGLSPSMW